MTKLSLKDRWFIRRLTQVIQWGNPITEGEVALKLGGAKTLEMAKLSEEDEWFLCRKLDAAAPTPPKQTIENPRTNGKFSEVKKPSMKRGTKTANLPRFPLKTKCADTFRDPTGTLLLGGVHPTRDDLEPKATFIDANEDSIKDENSD